MAKGRERHQARLDAVNALGRPLARRAKSRCELCETQGVSLKARETPPLSDEPELDRTLLLCEPCVQGLDGRLGDTKRWRFLSGVMWSEQMAVQVSAIYLLRQLAAANEQWAQNDLDGLYLDPEAEAWLDSL